MFKVAVVLFLISDIEFFPNIQFFFFFQYVVLLEEVVQMSKMSDEIIMKVLYGIRNICIKWSKVYCVAQILLKLIGSKYFVV